ncbi:DUF4190 domain-containing protein [Viridibacillus sp. NPDC093762]|uniref:DUF4190 domain-containing protein n=1 Tax=Viridibacillus sp. NPDC093762 TaxID=3390720 RepID=UPI003D0013A4
MASLTLGILSIFITFVGLIFGIIGIVLSSKSMLEIDHSGEKGKDLAILGKICSIV